MTNARKVSLSFPEGMNLEIETEARARGMKVCKLIRLAWVLSRRTIGQLPAPSEMRPLP